MMSKVSPMLPLFFFYMIELLQQIIDIDMRGHFLLKTFSSAQGLNLTVIVIIDFYWSRSLIAAAISLLRAPTARLCAATISL